MRESKQAKSKQQSKECKSKQESKQESKQAHSENVCNYLSERVRKEKGGIDASKNQVSKQAKRKKTRK